MRKNIKGFTLVECLVAMAILAIACMTLGAIEASVAKTNNANHFMNSSLANQMAYIEKYINAETLPIINTYTGGADGKTPPSGTNSGTNAYVKIESSTTNEVYSYPVDIYIMYSRDTHDTGSDDSGYSTVFSEENNNLRYKYLLGH